MIVNTAYAFMAKSAPANPIIFDKNVINYRYKGSANPTPQGFRFNSFNNVSFSAVDCTKRKSLTIVGEHSLAGLKLNLTVTFNKNGEQTGASVQFPGGSSTHTVSIPEKYQTDNVSIIFTAGNLPTSLLLTSATLS